VVVQGLPERIRLHGPRDPAPTTLAQSASELVYTPLNELQMLGQMLQSMLPHPPFTSQLDHEQTVAYWQGKLEAARTASAQADIQVLYDQYAAALRKHPDDVLMAVEFIRLLSATGNDRAAAQQLGQLMARLPRKSPLAKAGASAATM
jgi:hypothetical protein